ncbi:2711_t:CDS:2, partial [Entrophospora sp. SA101]
FAIATSPVQLSDDNRNSLLITTIVLGTIHLTVEVRQFIWKPSKYIKDFQNYFGMELLKTAFNFDLSTLNFNSDLNNSWNLVNRYYTYFANNNSYNQDSFLVQLPGDNINIFARFPSSILAMYNFLAGDKEVLGNMVSQDDAYLVVLIVAFSFIVVSYDAPIVDICKKIREANDSNEDTEYIPDRLRELAGVSKKTENDFDSIEAKLAEMSKKNRK